MKRRDFLKRLGAALGLAYTGKVLDLYDNKPEPLDPLRARNDFGYFCHKVMGVDLGEKPLSLEDLRRAREAMGRYSKDPKNPVNFYLADAGPMDLRVIPSTILPAGPRQVYIDGVQDADPIHLKDARMTALRIEKDEDGNPVWAFDFVGRPA